MNSREVVRTARTALFVPGDRPDRFEKAAASDADVVIIDLEDAVEPGQKPGALANVVAALSPGGGIQSTVRINSPTSHSEWAALTALSGQPGNGLLGVVVPKAESADRLTELRADLPDTIALVAIIESAAGLTEIDEIARVPGLDRLAFGAFDLALDVNADDDRLLDAARARMVFTSRAAQIAAPLDSPTTAIQDLTAVTSSARKSRAFGFGGKLCIHPRQIPIVVDAYRPTANDIAWARRVIGSEGARQVDGTMVDRPVVERARRILALDTES